jgi:radical SAM superfamily enzyme YgiQ (UPF0313 family)
MCDFIIWNSYDFALHSPVRPMGAHQIAHHLSNFGYRVKVIDFSSLMTTKQLLAVTERYITKDTVAIGASNTFWNSDSASVCDEPQWLMKARNIIEIKYPNLIWVLGGSRTAFARNRYEWLKFNGFAEDVMLKFLDEKSSKNQSRPLFDIQSLDHRYLDDLHIRSDEVLGIELSRGCQFKCTFCRYPLIGKKKNTYIRDYDLVERELLENYQRYGTTRYYIMDDTVNESEEKIVNLAEIASRLPFKLEWVGYLRLDLIASKPHTAQLLQDSGLRNAFFGIESFSSVASKMVGKGWNGNKAKDYLLELRDIWKNDTVWQLAFITGLTGETSQELDETQQWCIDNKMHSWFWNPLSISKNPNLVWKSYFDQNYSEFGYSFPTNDPNYWVNDMWNSETATIKAKQLTDDMQQYNKLGPWASGEVASVGYQFDDFMHKYKHEIDFDVLKTKTGQIVNEYVEKMLQ